MRYTSNPTSGKTTKKGYLHAVINSRLRTGGVLSNIRDLFQNEYEVDVDVQWTSSRGYAVVFHAGNSSDYNTDHLHIIWYHYNNSPATANIWNFANKHGLQRCWERVHDLNASFKYLHQKGRENRVMWKAHGLDDSGKSWELSIGEPYDTIPNELGGPEVESCLSPLSTGRRENEGDNRSTTSARANNLPGQIETVGKPIMRFINTILQEAQVVDESEFLSYVVQYGNETTQMEHIKHTLNPHYNRLIRELIKMNSEKLRLKNWQELMDLYNPRLSKIRCVKNMPINISVEWIKKWCLHNKLNIKDFVETVNGIINRSKPKRNFIHLEGPPNSAKSRIANSLARSCITPFICPPLNAKSSQFALQDAQGARIMLVDEPIVTEEFVESFKLLTAGEPVATDVKNKSSISIARIPVVVASNNPITHYVRDHIKTTFQAALDVRGPRIQCTAFDQAKYMSGDIHPLAWYRLVREYLHGERTFVSSSKDIEYPIGDVVSSGIEYANSNSLHSSFSQDGLGADNSDGYRTVEKTCSDTSDPGSPQFSSTPKGRSAKRNLDADFNEQSGPSPYKFLGMDSGEIHTGSSIAKSTSDLNIGFCESISPPRFDTGYGIPEDGCDDDLVEAANSVDPCERRAYREENDRVVLGDTDALKQLLGLPIQDEELTERKVRE